MPDNQSPELFGQTPSQTVGPFFHYALPWKGGADLVGVSELGARPDLLAEGHDQLHRTAAAGAVAGPVITLVGQIRDGDGAPVPDALVEIWQADASGHYDSSNAFAGFGRCATDTAGMFRFRTLRPGATRGQQAAILAPHIAVGVLGRGLLKRLVTRLYFAGAAENDDDPVLALVPPERRATLLAVPQGEAWRFDIVLQGPAETVFFQC